MDPIEPTAQGTPAGENGNVNNTNDGVSPGVQRRIDEVIAQLHNQNRELQAVRELSATQQATIAQYQNRQAAPQEVQAPEIDPGDAEKIAYYVNKANAPLQAQIQQLIGIVGETRVAPQLNAVQNRLAQIKNPAIEKRYNDLIALWQRDGRLQRGVYVPQDALNVAAGEFALGQLNTEHNSNQERQQYNNGFTPLGAAGGRTAPATAAKAAGKNIEDMSVDELQAQINAGNQANPDGHNL